ncbi:FUSC family protein [Streptomyces sp. NPDC001520]|uniref:FUSC family protein n=1 Tax=Streptomyces sp. NPDC001520 TaxID=3364581 RepID=UPI0036BFF536
MLTFSMPLRRTPRFDPTWMHLRATAVAMATVLGAYGCALLIEQKAGLHVDSIVQCVVIASALGRIQRVLDRTDRLLSCAVLPCAAAGGTELTTLIQRHPQVGDVVFVLAMAGSIWLRRFGLRAARVGTLVTLPLVAVLVVPGGTGAVGGHERTGWAAVMALVAVAWGTLLMWVAQRIGLVGRPPAAQVVTAAGPARRGIPAGTRMALQMAAALAAAFTAGRMLWPDHWAWVVLTAFLVSSGARSRADVLVKGAWRTVGASAGTVVAGAVTGSFGPRSDTVVVLIFAVLTVGTWLRELSYAYWAGCVTAVLSLLYDWFGQSPGDLLRTRLAAIAVGAAIGVTASWLVLPIRTSSAVRARTATTLAALIELLEADWHDGRAVHLARARFRHRVEQLEVTTAPLRILAALPLPHAPSARRRRRIGALGALRAVAALRRCAGPVGDLTAAITSAPDTLADDPSLGRRREEVAAHALAIRRAIGRRPAPQGAPGPNPPAKAGPPGPGPEAAVAMRTLAAIDTQLGILARVFRQPPVTPASNPAVPTPRFEKRMS